MKQEQQKIVAICAAAGALAIASVIAWRHYERPRKGASFGKVIKVGIVGTGWGVRVQLPQFRQAGLEVTAISSRDQDRAVSLAAEHHILYPFGNVISLCQSPEVDVVSIVTPVYLHAEQCIAALVAGKHMLVEKPLALNVGEAERILEAASAHSEQVAIVDHELRFTPMMQRAKELLREGLIGHVNLIESTAYMVDLGKKWSWWSDEAAGGGVLAALGSHMIDTCRFLLDAEFEAVSAHIETLAREREDPTTGRPRAVTADDYASVQYRLAPRRHTEDALIWSRQASIQGHFTAALSGSPPRHASSFLIVGSKGSISLDTSTSSMTASVGGKEVAWVKGKDSAFHVTGTRELGRALQRALGPEQDRAALRPAATIADGLAVMYVMEAARRSALKQAAWTEPQIIDTH